MTNRVRATNFYMEQVFSSQNDVMETEVLPGLHVKQFAFLQVEKGSVRVLQAFGVDAEELSSQYSLALAGEAAGKFRISDSSDLDAPFSWVRLSLELKVGEELVGLWLFGQRDPDDYYSPTEINLLKSLAEQTAIAMSNTLQTQRVLEMYQQNISKHENERMRLALDLHDSILNLLASLYLSLDDTSISPRFQEAYENLTGQLREIVSDLHPPMLNYGLGPALEELVESLSERSNGPKFILRLKPSENRYSPEVEKHLFRIVQEACENSLQHGHPKKIHLIGCLFPSEITLDITDDGVGFDSSEGFELAGLLANKYFGLAGMLERAKLIGGEIKIDSQPSGGTRVNFRWKAPKPRVRRTA